MTEKFQPVWTADRIAVWHTREDVQNIREAKREYNCPRCNQWFRAYTPCALVFPMAYELYCEPCAEKSRANPRVGYSCPKCRIVTWNKTEGDCPECGRYIETDLTTHKSDNVLEFKPRDTPPG